ncbi:hypothetical protein M5Y83_09090 [Neisseria meningitidis]|nr:hypothetical protein [Neisseria meningitidis]
MNKTLKRRVFRHTALYAAILMFSHTGGGGAGAISKTPHSPITDNAQRQHRYKHNVPINDQNNNRQYTHYN